MATTVEARSRAQAAEPAERPAWYRRYQRQLMAAGIAIAALLLVGWFVLTSGKRKEEFAARSLNQARSSAEAGNLPLASSQLQKLISTYRGTDAAREAVIPLTRGRRVNAQGERAVVGPRGFLAP